MKVGITTGDIIEEQKSMTESSVIGLSNSFYTFYDFTMQIINMLMRILSTIKTKFTTMIGTYELQNVQYKQYRLVKSGKSGTYKKLSGSLECLDII